MPTAKRSRGKIIVIEETTKGKPKETHADSSPPLELEELEM